MYVSTVIIPAECSQVNLEVTSSSVIDPTSSASVTTSIQEETPSTPSLTVEPLTDSQKNGTVIYYMNGCYVQGYHIVQWVF